MDDDRRTSSEDMPDAGAGGAGAPPDTRQANRAPSDLTREYEGDGIRVQWFASRCIHSAACIRAQPQVFDPRRRPWVDLHGADADAAAEAVLRCPTGALHFTRTDGGPPEPEPQSVRVTPVRDGPLIVRGALEIVDAAGNLIRRDTRMALCRCGRTKHAPFCDNSHRETGFRMEEAVGVSSRPRDDTPR